MAKEKNGIRRHPAGMTERFFKMAVLAALICFGGCNFAEQEEKAKDAKEEKQEDRFAFLRREQHKKIKKSQI